MVILGGRTPSGVRGLKFGMILDFLAGGIVAPRQGCVD